MHVDDIWFLCMDIVSLGAWIMCANFAVHPRFVNPVLTWCYAGEDLMGKMSVLAGSCTRGNTMWGVTNKCLEKYVQAFDLSLRDPDEWLRSLRT